MSRNTQAGWEALLNVHHAKFKSVDSITALTEFLAKCERHPNVILSDYHLGAHTTAIDILRSVNAALEDSIPMLVVTGEITDVGAQDELRGFTVLRKPVDSARLIDELLKTAKPAAVAPSSCR